MDSISLLIFQLAVLLGSVIIHEVSHGLMALRLGDDTAKLAGRLTLNPIKHLDPVGSFIFPLLLIVIKSPVLLGWAKPVPYNPALLHKDYKYGPLKVALAGPASNLLVAGIVALVIRIGISFLNPVTVAFLGFIVFINVLLAIFNLVPIPPLDGSKIIAAFLPPQAAMAFERIGLFGIFFILFLLYFFLNVIYNLSFLVFDFLVGNAGTVALLQLLGG